MSDFSSPKKGSNIICRVSNATPEMVCKYVSRLPKQKMREEDFREYMGKSWFQNEHQAPEQWGLYYIDGTYYYPRFDRDITLEEAEKYLYGWIKRLIVINPYTRFKVANDSRLVESIVKQLELNPNEHDLKTIFRNIIQSDEPFVVNEIIANALNTYSEVLSVKVIDKDSEKFSVSLLPNYKEILKTKYNMTRKEYFDSFNGIDISSSNTTLLQFDDATKFVWECIKFFNNNKELKQLLSSDYRANGGSTGNYLRINGCFVAQLGQNDTEGIENIYTDEEGYLNNGFDAREVDKFAVAVNDVFANRYKVVIEDNLFKLIKLQSNKQIAPKTETPAMESQDYQYMAAIKTKPFLILGGFSGTGKSIAVKSLAFATCPCDGYLNTSETSPGNYLLLSVKPNWHDATEITGFRSSVNRNYYVTDFMKFVIKAKLYEKQNVPFFVCLDEMNLAPVEEYFADFLSVIESRTKRQDGKIVTDALISKSVFNDSNYADDFNIFLELGIHPTVEVNDITEFNARLKESKEDAFYQEQWLVDELKEQGMTIPQNLVVIGTVNMDDTTNSFSRKVIDRAMTFETVVGEFDVDDYFAEGSSLLMEYCQKPTKGELYISDEVRATDLSSEYLNEDEKGQIINFINNINKDLDGTPFQISYRVLNETILLYRSKKEINRILGGDYGQNVEFPLGLNNIFDDILMQKILPRIEGDYDKCHTAIENLSRRAKDSDWKRSVDKLAFMERRFGPDKSGFTSFWN